MSPYVPRRVNANRRQFLFIFAVLLSLSAFATGPLYTRSLATHAAAASPGAISFSSGGFSVAEPAGGATVTLTRTGGTDSAVATGVTVADVTTSPDDYSFKPGTLDTSFIMTLIGSGPLAMKAITPQLKRLPT